MAQHGDIYLYKDGVCPSGQVIDFTDKIGGVNIYVQQMIERCAQMFTYTGLPSTIKPRILDLKQMIAGYICVTHIPASVCLNASDEGFHIFTGSIGGEYDIDLMPTKFMLSNPRLKKSLELTIGVDCVIIPNDSLYRGVMPMFNRYASMLAENDATIRIADINARIINLISAGDDTTLKSAKQYIEDVEKGKLGVIAEEQFLEGLRSQPYATSGSTNNITQLIELQQYLKASWFNDIGLQANYNMKREAVNTSEAQMNNDALLPLVQDWLVNRQRGWEQVNALYGTNVTVDFANAWKARAVAQDEDIKNPDGGKDDDKNNID